MNLNDLPDMSDALKQVQMYEKKKLDPVGKEDGDIDNDGDKDSSDSYLLNRRKTVTKAMGKKTHLCAKMVKKEGKEYQTIPEQHTMLEDGTVTHYDITDGETILENVPVEELEILVAEAHEHFDNYDKNAEVLGEADSLAAMAARREKRLARQRKQMGTTSTGQDFGHDYGISSAERKKRQQAEFDKFVGKKTKKEAFAFSEAELEELALHEEEIDALTDEQLIEFFEEAILEMAEDDQDLIEICEHLEEVEILSEASDSYYDSAVKSSKDAAKKNRMARLKKAAAGAAKKVGSAAKAAAAKAKPVAKAAAKGAARGAGYAAGLAKRAAKSAKSEFAKGKERGEKGSGGSSSSSDDDGTDGKLDSVLSSIRGSKGTSSGGGSSSASSGGGGKKKGPGLLRKAGRLVKKGLKKAVGKTSRLISKGSDKLAKRLGEDYDKIAHLHESGLFSIQEIENVIEEGYKEIDQSKKNKMFRRAGNLSRDAISTPISPEKRQDAHKKSGKIVKQLNKLNQEGK